jgi:hypothetical protein
MDTGTLFYSRPAGVGRTQYLPAQVEVELVPMAAEYVRVGDVVHQNTLRSWRVERVTIRTHAAPGSGPFFSLFFEGGDYECMTVLPESWVVVER